MADKRANNPDALADPKSALASTFNVPEIKTTMRELRDSGTDWELNRAEQYAKKGVKNGHIHASLDSILG